MKLYKGLTKQEGDKLLSIYNSSFGIVRISEILKNARETSGRIHLIGVLGAGQSAIAGLLLEKGYRLSGSDIKNASKASELLSLGLEYYPSHDEENVKDAALVVYTLAISDGNPEYVYARTHGIPTVSRAELASALASRCEKVITVAGSHGKSTTTAMLAHMFTIACKAPTVLSGAELTSGKSYAVGENEFFIAEACEYKDSFLKLRPSAAIINNVELDHTDYFSDLRAIKRSFSKYASRASDFALLCADDPGATSLAVSEETRVITFGSASNADYRYTLIALGGVKSIFSVFSKSHGELGEFEINVPGVFNISNATAAIGVAMEYGLDLELLREGVASFRGIGRRLEYIGEYRARPVFYDYAHHPTEIFHGIGALRAMGHDPITVVFKPHTYSRTAHLFSDFARSLSLADYCVVGDIYAAREENVFGVTPEALAREIGESAFYSPDEYVTKTLDNLTRGAIIIMGAADMTEILKRMNLGK